MTSTKDFSKSVLGALSRWHPVSIRRRKNGLTIFTFHEVSDGPSDFLRQYKLSTGIELFKKQVNWISSRFEIISSKDLLANRIPDSAAMITFDDGWVGSFENATPYLADNKIPSLHFLNMAFVKGEEPLLPAFVAFMEKEQGFHEFVVEAGLQSPYYLSMTPKILERYLKQANSASEVLIYQGKSVDQTTLRYWGNNPYVQLGNHLYQHWNSAALTPSELAHQYKLNEMSLREYANSTPLFSIPHGQWGSCFRYEDYLLIKSLGAARIFANCGTVNNNKESTLLDRINISQETVSPSQLDFTVNKGSMFFRCSLQENVSKTSGL